MVDRSLIMKKFSFILLAFMLISCCRAGYGNEYNRCFEYKDSGVAIVQWTSSTPNRRIAYAIPYNGIQGADQNCQIVFEFMSKNIELLGVRNFESEFDIEYHGSYIIKFPMNRLSINRNESVLQINLIGNESNFHVFDFPFDRPITQDFVKEVIEGGEDK